MAILEKDDIGMLGVGGLAGLVAKAGLGLGTFGVVAAALGGAYLGHKLFEYYNNKPAGNHGHGGH